MFLNPVSLCKTAASCYGSVSNCISVYLRERRELKEEIRLSKEKERIKNEENKQKEREAMAIERAQRKSIFDKDSLSLIWQNLLKSIQDMYYNILEGSDIIVGDSLNERKIKTIIDYSESCQNYASFFNVANGLDMLVSSALNEELFDIRYDHGKSHSNQLVVGQVQFYKRPRLIFDLKDNKINDWIRNLDGKIPSDFSYQLFESILHAKTHQVLKQNESHHKPFYDKKEELRTQIVDYLLRNQIKIEPYTNSLLIKNSRQLVKFVPAEEFMKMGGLKIRGLIKKKYKLQKEHAEIKKLMSK